MHMAYRDYNKQTLIFAEVKIKVKSIDIFPFQQNLKITSIKIQ